MISHRVNDLLRFLTAFSVVILPLTLIASVFGMNVAFPFDDGVGAFWVIVGSMIALLVTMLGFFRRRGWL